MNLLRDTRKHRKERSMKHRKVKSKKHRKKHRKVKSRNIKNTKNKNIYSGGYYNPTNFTPRDDYSTSTPADYYVNVHAGTYYDDMKTTTYLKKNTNGVISGFKTAGYAVQLIEGEHAGTTISVKYNDVDHNPIQ
tara:strand:- start:5 stop:406 length:402 start_codon:yes stop_codon:yes gene_type:complete